MRRSIGLVLALAAAAAGCRSLGLYEETSRDMSDKNTKAGDYAVNQGTHKVKVTKFETDFKSAPGSVNLGFVNEGSPEEFISFDVEFGYPSPPDSIAPYVPEFFEVSFADWKTGEVRTLEQPGALHTPPQTPLFARVVSVSGSDVRMTAARETPDSGLRRGTSFLGNQIEVVKIEGNLTPPAGTKPTIAFTLESQKEGGEVGAFKYMVQFYKDGKPMDLGRKFRIFQPASKPLGKKGDTVVVDVTLDTTASLAGVKPVLRVVQQ